MTLGDPGLRAALRPRRAAGSTPRGRPAAPRAPAGPRGHAASRRGGREVSAVVHRARPARRSRRSPRRSPRPRASRSSTSGCTPLRRAKLDELRASRARIVAAADAERRRLERDLHDGAQQRLVDARARRPPRAPPARRRRRGLDDALATAEEQLQIAVAELRELAHGLFPAVLGEEGLAAALEALAEDELRARARRAARAPLPARGRVGRLLPRRRGAAPGTAGDVGVDAHDEAGRLRRRRPRPQPRSPRSRPRRGSRRRRSAAPLAADSASRCARSCHAPRDRRRRDAPARRASRACSRTPASRSPGAAATPTRCCAWSTRAGPTSRSSTSACRPTHGDDGLVAAQEIRAATPTSACSCSPTTSSRATPCGCSRRRPSAPATCSRSASPTSPCSPTRCAASTRASA